MHRPPSLHRLARVSFCLAFSALSIPSLAQAETLKTRYFSFEIPLNWYEVLPEGMDLNDPARFDLTKAVIEKRVTGDTLSVEGILHSEVVETGSLQLALGNEGKKEGMTPVESGFQTIGNAQYVYVVFNFPAPMVGNTVTYFARGAGKIELRARAVSMTKQIDSQAMTVLANLTVTATSTLQPWPASTKSPRQAVDHDALGRFQGRAAVKSLKMPLYGRLPVN